MKLMKAGFGAAAVVALTLGTWVALQGQDKSQPPVAPGKALGDILSRPAAVKAAVDSASKKQAIAEPSEANSTKAGDAPASGDSKVQPGTAPTLSSFPRRDPFRPYTVSSKNSNARRRENLSPLERYELGQLKLVAVIWNAKEPSAMVEDASGLGYLVKIGTPIGPNDGKVTAIRRDGILIEEYLTDFYGVTKKQESSMRLSAESAG